MKHFNVIVVGCGKMSGAWIDYANRHKEDISIVALVDIVEENAKKTAEQFDLGCPVFTDLDTALSKIKR